MKTERIKCLWVLAAFWLSFPHPSRAAVSVGGGATNSARINDFEDFGCQQSPGGAGAPRAEANDAGGNNASCPTCPSPNGSPEGMPRWWVDEPYINLHVTDEPLSYQTSSGQEMDFRMYYKQRFSLPAQDQIPDFYDSLGYPPRSEDYTTVQPYVYWGREYAGSPSYTPDGMASAAWMNNWQEYIFLWDYGWETSEAYDQLHGAPLPPPPFSQGYEALAFMPNGGVNYFTSNCTNQSLNPSTQLGDPVSQVQLSSYPYSHPSPTNPPLPDANGIYWGNSNSAPEGITNGLVLTYPDGSKDVFGLTWWLQSGADVLLTDAGALLTQKIDPQGRVTRLGYFQLNITNACNIYAQPQAIFVLKYVVDPDGRTNTFVYNGDSPEGTPQLQEIDDPFGRKAIFGYQGCENPYNYPANPGWLTYIIDAQGMSNSFTYGPSAYDISANGWLATMQTPYGTNSFYYGDATDPSYPTNYEMRATCVEEPTGAMQLFGYYQNAGGLIESSAASPSVGGWVFDNGTDGDGVEALSFRNSFHWDRLQTANLSGSVWSNLPAHPVAAISGMGTTDLHKGQMQHWLLGSDGISITSTLSSERDPSPDPGGTIEGQRTWYAYGQDNAGAADDLLTTQIGAIAQVLPDGTAQSATYSYYATGLVSGNEQSYTEPGGGVGELTTGYSYAANGIDLTEVANSLGQSVTMGYNGSHQVTSITDALGEVTSIGWESGSHNISSLTLPTGQEMSFTYYASNTSGKIYSTNSFLNGVGLQPENLSTVITAYTNALPQIVHGTGTGLPTLLVTNSWDKLNRLTGTGFQDGTTISNIYTNLDLLASKDRVGNWTYYVHDGLQHLTYITNALNKVTEFTWCECGSLTSISNALGNITYLNRNNQGLVTNVMFPDLSSMNWQYDLPGRVTKEFDGSGNSQQYAYNNQNQVIAVNNIYGQVFGAYYDAVGRPLVTTNANGVIVNNTFDLVNRLTSRARPANDSVEIFAYATNGLVAYTNQDNQWTLFDRDAASRLIGLTNAVQTNSFAYNALDELTSLTDGLSQTTTWGFNQYGWLTSKSNTYGTAILTNGYDPDGRVTTRWMMGTNTKYRYDAVGNLTNVIYPAFTTVYEYDAINELITMLDQAGTTSFTWTSNYQLASETGPWVSNTVSYTYSQGHRASLSLTQPGGSPWPQTYSYDGAWRMTGLTSPAGTFNYTPGGASAASSLIAAIALPNGAFITNSYDALGRLTSTALNNYWGHTLDGYVYGVDLLGLRTNITRQLGLTTNNISAGYDPIAEITSWLGAEANGTPRENEQLNYDYDAGGNLLGRTNNALTQAFTVNSLNELSSVARTGTLTVSGALPAPSSGVTVNGTPAQTNGDFTFAATGNALSNGTNTFTIIATNLYGLVVTNTLSLNLPATVNYQYDANGNLTNDGTRSFVYDAENRLTNVYVTNVWQVGFAYDGLGRRRITTNSTWQSDAWVVTNITRYIYDGSAVIQERDTNNNVLVTYTRGVDMSGSLQGAGGIGGLLARTDTNGSTYYHADGSGNITALINGVQDIVARYEYDPYGRLIGQWGTNAAANVYRFSSKEYDTQTGLYYYGARFYDPTLQRFLNKDPVGELGGINLYGFVGNSPVNYFDPYGLTLYYSASPIVASQGGTYGPYVVNVPDGSDAVVPAESEQFARIDPEFYGGGGMRSTDLDFLPFFLPEIPAVSKALDAAGDALGNLGKKLFKPKPTECPKPALTGPEAARAALGKGPNAIPGAPLTPEMRAALQQNLQAAQNSLNLAQQGLNVAGNQISAEQAAIQAATAQARINEVNAVLQSGAQAPQN